MRRLHVLFLLLLTLLACEVAGGPHAMPTQYNGIPSNITPSTVLVISSVSASGTNPAVITTSAAHGLTTGDAVDISSVEGATAVNGEWRFVTVLTSTTFSVPIASNGTYSSGNGRVAPQSLGATYQIPSDGDPLTASSVNVALETLGDRSAFLAFTLGQSKLFNLSFFTNTTLLSWGSLTTSDTNQHTVTSSWTVPGVISGDVLDLELYTSYTQATNPAYLSLEYDVTSPGVATSPTSINGAQAPIPVTATATATQVRGLVVVPSNKAGTLNVWPAVQVLAGGGAGTITLIGNYTMVIKVWRPTTMPQ